MAEVSDQLKKILALSEVDKEMGRLLNRWAEIPELLRQIEENSRSLEKSLEEKGGIRASLEKEKKDRDLDLQSSRESAQKREARLSEIKTNKEYQAALKEIEQAKKENGEIEANLVRMTEQMEQVSQEMESLRQKATEEASRIQGEASALREEEQGLATALQDREGERAALMKGLEISILAKYERVKKIRADAVAFAERGSCGGCHMSLPPQLFNQILRQTVVHTCPSCYRIMVLREDKE